MNKNVVKILAALLAVMISVFAFSGCSANTEEESASHTVITTDSAVAKDYDAVALIKSYTQEELGLSESLDSYEFMVSGNGEELEGNYYIKVTAAKISEPKADGTVDIDTYGEYFISYDAKTILTRNQETGDVTAFEEVHNVPEKITATSHSSSENE